MDFYGRILIYLKSKNLPLHRNHYKSKMDDYHSTQLFKLLIR
jgi:hypothetical protein